MGASVDPHLQKEVDNLLRKAGNDPAFTSGESDPEDLFKVLAKERVGACVLMVVKVSRRLREPLTTRESQVAALIGHGLGNKGIAAQLAISEKRTEHLVGQIKAKWGVATRAEIARCAWLLF